MAIRTRMSASEARRIALAAQGFDRPRPDRPDDRRHYRRAMSAITVLQLDFVNVLIPAHFFMIWSRLGPYDRDRFEKWLYGSGDYTEQWAHEASVVSVTDWPLLRHRHEEFRHWKNSPLRHLPDADTYLERVLSQIDAEGGLTAADVPDPEISHRRKNPGDWHRPIQRWALEDHFGRGKLAVRRRQPNFQRVYDLPERLIPDSLLGQHLGKADAQRELLRRSSCALGIATCQDLADYYRMTPTEARPRLDELVEEGAIQRVRVEGWECEVFLDKAARIPRRVAAASLISPFDPLVWFRPRAERLFDFEYRIEIYVPAAKRRWGYYVLPFLEGERITARADLKADRKASVLLVQQAHRERCAGTETPLRLAAELRALADWLRLDSVSIKKASAFEKALAACVRSL